MAEGVFSIFPDSHRVLGSAVKDGSLSSQSKALRDVKNTLKSNSLFGKRATKHALGSSNSAPVKRQMKEPATESQSLHVYKDASATEFWGPCDSCQSDDVYPFLRSPNENLGDAEISYVMGGLLGLPSSDYYDDSDCSDLDCDIADEPFFPINNHFMDEFTIPTEIYLSLDDPEPPCFIDVEYEYE